MKKRKPITKSERFKTFERDEYTCQYCGKSVEDGVKLEVDHILPVSRGGSNISLNLVTSCFSCNRGKGKSVLDESSVLLKQQNEINERSRKAKKGLKLQDLIESKRNFLQTESEELKSLVEHINSMIAPNVISKSSLEKNIKPLLEDFVGEKILEAIDKAAKRSSPSADHDRFICSIYGIAKNVSLPPIPRKKTYIVNCAKKRYGEDLKDEISDLIDVLISNLASISPTEEHTINFIEMARKNIYKKDYESWCAWIYRITGEPNTWKREDE
mgnify:CR=1 FL=1|tara:strand:- start:43 stop:855 length:813 start_codon:yes stop_codon:yes gene_type:complete